MVYVLGLFAMPLMLDTIHQVMDPLLCYAYADAV
jgi:hypothetical protein